MIPIFIGLLKIVPSGESPIPPGSSGLDSSDLLAGWSLAHFFPIPVTGQDAALVSSGYMWL